MKIKFFKKENKFEKGNSDIKPDLYWKYILYTTFALIILFCFFGFYLFVKINKISVSSFPNVDQLGIIKKDRINKALEYFGQSERKSIEIINSPSPIVDPSL
jgi:hypothetical protein